MNLQVSLQQQLSQAAIECSNFAVYRSQVHKLSPEAQALIHSYTDEVTTGQSGPHISTHASAASSRGSGDPSNMLSAWTAAVTHTLPWRTPSREDYQALLEETEYGAW
jgi:hypothetical protein